MREASALEYAFAQTVVGAEQRRGAVGAGGGKEGVMIMDQKDMHYVDCSSIWGRHYLYNYSVPYFVYSPLKVL